jgi:putative transposase
MACLGQIEVAAANGKTILQACQEIAISQQSYGRWRKAYGGVQLDQAKGLKELERENIRLKKLVADASLDKTMLKEVASGNG